MIKFRILSFKALLMGMNYECDILINIYSIKNS